MNKTEIILECVKYLKTKTNSRFVFSGSYGLYIQDIDFNRDFHDIDVRFLDLSEEELKKLHLDFQPQIHKLGECPVNNPEYKEVEFHGEKILVFSPKTIIDCKKCTLDFIENKAKIKSATRLYVAKKIKDDLKYLKENYGIE